MMHFEAAIATATEAVPLGERSQEACADSPILDRRVVEEIDPDGRTGVVLGHRQEPRAEVAFICTGVLRPVVDLEVGARVCRGWPHFSTLENATSLFGTVPPTGISGSKSNQDWTPRVNQLSAFDLAYRCRAV